MLSLFSVTSVLILFWQVAVVSASILLNWDSPYTQLHPNQHAVVCAGLNDKIAPVCYYHSSGRSSWYFRCDPANDRVKLFVCGTGNKTCVDTWCFKAATFYANEPIPAGRAGRPYHQRDPAWERGGSLMSWTGTFARVKHFVTRIEYTHETQGKCTGRVDDIATVHHLPASELVCLPGEKHLLRDARAIKATCEADLEHATIRAWSSSATCGGDDTITKHGFSTERRDCVSSSLRECRAAPEGGFAIVFTRHSATTSSAAAVMLKGAVVCCEVFVVLLTFLL